MSVYVCVSGYRGIREYGPIIDEKFYKRSFPDSRHLSDSLADVSTENGTRNSSKLHPPANKGTSVPMTIRIMQ